MSVNMVMLAWYNRNPLKQWQEANDITNDEVGFRIGYSQESIRRWKRGVVMPSDEVMQILIDLTGDKKLDKKWREWRDEAPPLKG